MYSNDDGFWMFLFVCAVIGFLGVVGGLIWFVVEAIIHLRWI